MFRTRRLAPVALLAALAAVLWVGYGASPAFAFVGPNPALDPANGDALQTLFGTGAVWTPADPTYPMPKVDDTATDLMKIAQDLGTDPVVDAVDWPTTLALGAGALYVGWKIPHVLGISDYFYGMFCGGCHATSNDIYSGPYTALTSTMFWETVAGFGSTQYLVPGMKYCPGSGCTPTTTLADTYFTSCSSGTLCTDPIQGATGVVQQEESTFAATATTTPMTHHSVFTSPCAANGTISSCTVNFYGYSSAEATDAYKPTYSGLQPTGMPATETAPTQAPSTSGNTSGQSNARSEISGDNCALQTYLGHQIDPTWTGTGTGCTASTFPLVPIYLPQPLPGETVQAYTQRLRATQFLGAITVTDDPMSYPSGSPALQAQPSTITAITVASAIPVTVPIFDVSGNPVAWPGDSPQIQSQSTSTDIQIQEVPPDFTPAPPPPPGSGSCGGGGICIPPVNFDCQFPFGFVCWAQTVTGWFNVSPQAPDFNFTIPDQTVGGNTYHVGSHYDVNLNVMDDYMTIFRSILSVVIWVGGIYWLAARLLGFHPAGDPGAAIDEGIGGEG